MWINYNANPISSRVGDCVVRAISTVTDKTWTETFTELAVQSIMLCDMPSSDNVWGNYLKHKGFKRYVIPTDSEMTVEDFCRSNPKGIFILSISGALNGSGHVVAVKNGDYYDTWNSGKEYPTYYWRKEE